MPIPVITLLIVSFICFCSVGVMVRSFYKVPVMAFGMTEKEWSKVHI